MHIYFEDCRKPEVVALVELHRWSFVFADKLFVVLADKYERVDDYVYFYMQGLIIAMFPSFVVNKLICEEVVKK